MRAANPSPRPHAVFVPYPAQGHVGPMLKLAKLLHSIGFHITFVNNEHNHRRFLRSRGPHALDGLPSFRFEAIPDGLAPSDPDATQDVPSLSHAIMNDFLQPFKKLLLRLNNSTSSPPVTLILSDAIMYFTLDAAQQLGGIPVVLFWTASACGFLGYYHYRSLLNMGVLPFKDASYQKDGSMDAVVEGLPSMNGIQLKYLPSFLRTTNVDDTMMNYLMISTERAAQSSVPIIINTFDAFERDVLEDIYKIVTPSRIYTIGPFQFLETKYASSHNTEDVKSLGNNLWKQDTKCLEWLDSKEPNSVIYVSFGSITTMTDENLIEFAWGLANSNHPFLWVVRPDVQSGTTGGIPLDFLAKTKDRGLIASWCDQEKVLSHPSVGIFLTHCGWNSTLDTICGGVPVLCWPFFAEQQTNCWFSSGKWGIGMEIDNEVRREKVEMQVKELMEEEKGKQMKDKAMEWKKLAEEATQSPLGSSYLNFDKLINQVLLPQKQQNI